MTKVTFNLPISEFDELKHEAEIQSRTVTDLIRRAIGTELFLAKQERNGVKIILDDNGSLQRLIRR